MATKSAAVLDHKASNNSKGHRNDVPHRRSAEHISERIAEELKIYSSTLSCLLAPERSHKEHLRARDRK
jgi:hypothetical protein